MARRRFTEREVLATLIHQGVVIRCFRCQAPFGLEKTSYPGLPWVGTAEREHLHEHGLGGPDEPANCRYSCPLCHSKVTNGSKATTANSSKHRIAKVKRIVAGGRKRRGPPMRSAGFRKPPPGYKHKWGSRPMRPFRPREDVRE